MCKAKRSEEKRAMCEVCANFGGSPNWGPPIVTSQFRLVGLAHAGNVTSLMKQPFVVTLTQSRMF